ncbi:MAG: aminoacyl-tRNA hydrolase [bacterium]
MIVGLGNPGPKYNQTRHNAGFWFVDELARRAGGEFRPESKFSGEVCKLLVDRKTLWLLKPGTFMNRSGLPVKQLSSFYKIPLSSILVAHDELDLSPGVAKFKLAGGHGGHNGLRDIFSHLGKDFWRLRLGVGHPGSKDEVVDYVLNRPGKADEAAILAAIDHAADELPSLLSGDFEQAMHHLHSR